MGIKINEYPIEGTDINDDSYIDVDQWNGVSFESNKVKWLTVLSTAIRGFAKLASNNVFTGTNRFNKQVKIVSDGTNSPLVVRDSTDTVTVADIRNSDSKLISYFGIESVQSSNSLSAIIESVHSGSGTSTVIQQTGNGSTIPNLSLFASKGNVVALKFMTNGDVGFGGSSPIQFNAGGYLENIQMQVKPNGQVSIGTVNPDASAIFQVDSTTQGILIPRLTTTERNAMGSTLPTSLLLFNTTTNQYEFWDGSAWVGMQTANLLPLNNIWTGTNRFNKQVKIVSDGTNSPLVVRDSTDTVTEFQVANKSAWATGGGNVASNTAYGQDALMANTTGANSTGMGVSALKVNTIGVNNTVVGRSAAAASVNGNDLSAIGTYTLLNLNSGSGIVAHGSNSGRFIADGTTALTQANQSLFLGAFTKSLANNQSNEIVIGYDAIGKGSNTVVLGNSLITATYLKGATIINGVTADPTAIFQVDSTTKGVLIPRLTTTQRNAIPTPATSLLIFNTTTNQFEFWNGSAWVGLGGGASWGSITGTLSAQTDLQTALDAKVDKGLHFTASTTNNTPTNLTVLAIPNNTNKGVYFILKGRNNTTGVQYFEDGFAVFNSISGTTTQQGTLSSVKRSGFSNSVQIQFTIAGNNVSVNVIGASGQTINWDLEIVKIV